MDHTFDEDSETQDIYEYSVQSLVPFVVEEPLALPMAWPKHTMQGIQKYMAAELANDPARYGGIQMFVSYFEIYGGRCQIS